MSRAKRVLIGTSLAVIALLVTAVSFAPARDRAALRGWLSIAAGRASFSRNSADSMRSMIATAEAKGAAYPGAAIASSERRCVQPSGRVAVSGDIQAGDWIFYRHSWVKGIGKLWWHAARPSAALSDTSTLEVRAILLDRPLPVGAEAMSRSTRFNLRPVERRSDTLVFTLHEGKAQTQFPSGVRVPVTGRWMFIATMGDNWGCFLYRL